MAQASRILGIISAFLGWFVWIVFPLPIAGIILAIVGRKANPDAAHQGLLLCTLAPFIGWFALIFLLAKSDRKVSRLKRA